MRFCSAFAGVGGFDLGFERAGWTPVSQIEIDTLIYYDKNGKEKRNITGRYAKKVLSHHWPDATLLDDITTVKGTDLGDINVLVGGFPCQDTSIAAPHRDGLSGARSHAFYDFARLAEEYIRLVCESSPEWIVLENPDGVLHSRGGADMGAVLRTLASVGYVGAYRCFDLRDFGSPQRRKRVIAVGHLGGHIDGPRAVLSEGEPCEGNPGAHVDERAGTLAGRRPAGASAADRLGRLSFRKKARARGKVVDGAYETWVDEDVTNTITGFDSGVARATQLIVEGDRVRALTYTEKERLMGFPDGWTNVPGMVDSYRDALLGNSMAPTIAEWLAHRINAIPSLMEVAA